MINKASDYKYVGGDLNQVVIDGGIMPLRPAADKGHVRGEDVAFLLEAAYDRRSWWHRKMLFNSDGSLASDTTNSLCYERHPLYNRCPFSAAVNKGDGSARSAHALQDSLFTSNPSGNRYMTSAPYNIWPPKTTEAAAMWTPLTYDDRAIPDWGTSDALLETRIANTFADAAKVKYGYIDVRPNSDFSSNAWTLTKEAGSGEPTLTGGLMYHCEGSNDAQGQRAPGDIQEITTFQQKHWMTLVEVRAQAGISIFARIHLYGRTKRHGDSDYAEHYLYWVEDVTSITNIGPGSTPTINFPNLNAAWMKSRIRTDCGLPFYELSDLSGADDFVFCRYGFNVSFYIAGEIPMRTRWN